MNHKSKLEVIADQTRSRYSKRYLEMGYNVRTLGWGSIEQQELRFNRVLNAINIKNQHILDIGCGFGDFLTFCHSKNVIPAKYTGWDINPDLIQEAKRRHKDLKVDYSIVNLSDNNQLTKIADVGVMLGLLNYNHTNTFNNYDYTKMMLAKAFECVEKVLVVDFLSDSFDPGYPKEDFVYYHNPIEVFKYALTLTRNVNLIHDYPAIPQKEFMLILYK